MPDPRRQTLQDALHARFSDAPCVDDTITPRDTLSQMAGRGSCRAFQDTAVPEKLLNVLCATALASPSKSDLQQRDIIVVSSLEKRQQLVDCVPGQDWLASAPLLLVFCGNNRRLRLIHNWTGIPFENDHLDAFFNATADAAIALGAFVTAAEAQGLGCCPISAIRNDAATVSKTLNLPDHVFPFAGLAVGYPAAERNISMRLPLNVTCHTNSYSETDLKDRIEAYNAARNEARPFKTQRHTATFGISETYGWSEDKARQYSQPERADFGAFIRSIGFKLD